MLFTIFLGFPVSVKLPSTISKKRNGKHKGETTRRFGETEMIAKTTRFSMPKSTVKNKRYICTDKHISSMASNPIVCNNSFVVVYCCYKSHSVTDISDWMHTAYTDCEWKMCFEPRPYEIRKKMATTIINGYSIWAFIFSCITHIVHTYYTSNMLCSHNFSFYLSLSLTHFIDPLLPWLSSSPEAISISIGLIYVYHSVKSNTASDIG